MTKTNNTSLENSFHVLSSFPEGLAVFEFVDLMDTPMEKRCASARLSQFVAEGIARKAAAGRVNPATGQHCTVYVPVKPYSQRQMETRDPARKRKRPTNDELKALRIWKAEAIKRFPELGVDPDIMLARKQVAKILREEGNEAKAVMVESGELDGGETMRIVLSVVKGVRQ